MLFIFEMEGIGQTLAGDEDVLVFERSCHPFLRFPGGNPEIPFFGQLFKAKNVPSLFRLIDGSSSIGNYRVNKAAKR